MPIYLLGTRTRSVEIPNDPISVALVESGGNAELGVVPGASQRVVRVSPEAIVIPSLTEQVTVAVEPVGVATFGHDTVVQLVIGPDSSGAADQIDPVQVTFEPINVSGRRSADLATLTPRAGRVEVAVLASQDTPLGPLASMARTAARRVAGSRRGSPGGALSVAVDTSASMWWSFHDGSVAAAVDLVVGVADAVEIHEVTATMVGSDCTALQAPAAELAETVARGPLRWSAGARWSRVPQAEHTILVTDSVSHLARQRLPVLWISSDPRLGELGPVLPPPPPDVQAGRYLADNPAIVDEIAARLLEAMT